MPRSRYEEMQLALARLLIRVYYEKNPQKFAFIIKEAILQETRTAFIPGDVGSMNTVLRNTTLAKELFKFGIFCYIKKDFLTFLKTEIANEFDFFDEIKALAKKQFDQTIERAATFYHAQRGITSLLGQKEDSSNLPQDSFSLFYDIVGEDALKGKTQVLAEPYSTEEWAQIAKGLQDIFELIANTTSNITAINKGKEVGVVLEGQKYVLIQQRIPVLSDETPLCVEVKVETKSDKGCSVM